MELTKKEKIAFEILINQAIDRMSNNCCNDFDQFYEIFNNQEQRLITEDMDRWNKGKVEEPAVDWIFLSYLKDKILADE